MIYSSPFTAFLGVPCNCVSRSTDLHGVSRSTRAMAASSSTLATLDFGQNVPSSGFNRKDPGFVLQTASVDYCSLPECKYYPMWWSVFYSSFANSPASLYRPRCDGSDKVPVEDLSWKLVLHWHSWLPLHAPSRAQIRCVTLLRFRVTKSYLVCADLVQCVGPSLVRLLITASTLVRTKMIL